MKYLIFSDLHIGEHSSYDKNDNGVLTSFFDIDKIINQIINIIIKEKVNLIFFLGDLFNNINNIFVPTIIYAKFLFTKLSKYVPIIMLTGNHDQIFPSKLHQLTSIFDNDKNIKVVSNIYHHYFSSSNINMIFISYMKSNELQESINKIQKLNIIKKNQKNILFGHFTLSNYNDSYLNIFNPEIYYNSFFEKFDKIYLGHIHSQYKFNNVEYIGSCIYHNFSDSIEYNNTFKVRPLPVYIINDNLNQKIYYLKAPSYFLDVNMNQYIKNDFYKNVINTIINKNQVYIRIFYNNVEQKKYIDKLIDNKNIRYIFMKRNITIKNIEVKKKIYTINTIDYILNYIKNDSSINNKMKTNLIDIIKELSN